MIGPPKFIPNWLRLKVGFMKRNGAGAADEVGLKKPSAFRSVLRTKS